MRGFLNEKLMLLLFRDSIMMHFMVTWVWMMITLNKLKLEHWKLLRYYF